MILFVLEGEKREPALIETISHLFFPRETDKIICSYKNNIYNLYREMKSDGDNEDSPIDIVSVLRQKWENKPNDPFKEIDRSSKFSQVFLFFDYDCHHNNKDKKLTINALNSQLKEMLSFFDNETENGKLYINYPMIESIRYTKEPIDNEYNSYQIALSDCCDFKKKVAEFSYFRNHDDISFKYNAKNRTVKIPQDNSQEIINNIKTHWIKLIEQNVIKSLYLLKNETGMPEKKELISQSSILEKQILCEKENNSIFILNSFPLFLYEYFPPDRLYSPL